jgi:tetrahydrodipicolinate N-succinyltransferase
MKYSAEIGSGVMMYVPGFINIGSGIEKLKRVIHRYSYTEIAWR